MNKKRAMSDKVFNMMLDETFLVIRRNRECLTHPLDRSQLFITSNRFFANMVAKETKGKVISLKAAIDEQSRQEVKEASSILDGLLAANKRRREEEAAKLKIKKVSNRKFGKKAVAAKRGKGRS